jgi:hypothetical protein
MTEIGLVPESLFEVLSAPHVTLTFLLDAQFATGRVRMHPGWGTLNVGGYEWLGVTDPSGVRAVEIGAVQLAEPNVAAKVDLSLSGVDLDFLRAVRRIATENHREVEGRRADLYLVVFEPETLNPVTGLLPFFTDARMTAPSWRFDGMNSRQVTLGLEGIFSAKNFAPGGRLTTADQRRRYGTTDKFFQYVGGKLSYRWPK